MAELKTDLSEVQRTLEILKSGLVEIRMYDNKKIVTSGYFKEPYVNLLQGLNGLYYENCYFTLNDVKDDCYSREQREKYIKGVKVTTSDKDIEPRSWILIDADPNRSSGTSSSDAEKELSRLTLCRIYNHLRDVGFSYPVVADSGNGYHLLYKVNLKNADEITELIKNFLKYLDAVFTDDKVSIDTSVYNASRITKLYGTVARKGANTPERPHRLSRIIKVPNEINITDVRLIKKVADMLPKPEPIYANGMYAANIGDNAMYGDFDIKNFMAKYLRVERVVETSNSTKYLLEECPFNPNHKSPDSMIAVMNTGAIGFKCFHNSCSDRRWSDVREMFEPKSKRQYDSTRTTAVYMPFNVEPEEPETEIKQYYQLHEINNIDRSQIVSMPTGIRMLDSKIIGFNKKEVTVISGNNGSGKSTIIGQFMLNNIEKGFKCTLFSGEMTKERIKTWLHLQAAGRQHTKQSQYGENVYFTPKYISEQIDIWAKDKLFIHNNLVGVKFADVLKTVEETVKNEKTDIVYIDNLMSIDLSAVIGDKYERQTGVILDIVRTAKEHDIHIVFVCHPRKAVGFIRKDDISGTADLTNAVDNVIMCHRVNEDFKKRAGEFYGKPVIQSFVDKGYSNCIEVMKNRDLGYQDELIGLYFEKESKRFLNERFENVVYGWQSYHWEPIENLEEI